jgi:hypothetical protein
MIYKSLICLNKLDYENVPENNHIMTTNPYLFSNGDSHWETGAKAKSVKPKHTILYYTILYYTILYYTYYIPHCFICRPSDSTVATDAGLEFRTAATGALAVRRSNH